MCWYNIHEKTDLTQGDKVRLKPGSFTDDNYMCKHFMYDTIYTMQEIVDGTAGVYTTLVEVPRHFGVYCCYLEKVVVISNEERMQQRREELCNEPF